MPSHSTLLTIPTLPTLLTIPTLPTLLTILTLTMLTIPTLTISLPLPCTRNQLRKDLQRPEDHRVWSRGLKRGLTLFRLSRAFGTLLLLYLEQDLETTFINITSTLSVPIHSLNTV
jgi:hypothetical protein